MAPRSVYLYAYALVKISKIIERKIVIIFLATIFIFGFQNKRLIETILLSTTTYD